MRIPDTDVTVDVVADLPMRTMIEDVTRLLTRRHQAGSGQRTYPPTILELITLVEPRPAKPAGRTWLAIRVLNLGQDRRTREVFAEYCLEHCEIDPSTRAEHPKRRLMSYRTTEAEFVKRLNKKLGSLQKFAERPTAIKQ